MKKTLAISAMALMAFAAMAQTEGYNRIYAGYTPIKATDSDLYDDAFHGVNLGYTKGIAINKNLPLFIEVGVNAQFNMYSEKNYDYAHDMKLTMLQAQIPVNVTYALEIGDTEITIAPYAGVSAKFNIIGQYKLENPENGKSHTRSFFSKDDMGDDTANRFQMGMQFGANINLNKLSIGLGYQRDITAYQTFDHHSLKFHGFVGTIGYNF